jgi:hypothetical protein
VYGISMQIDGETWVGRGDKLHIVIAVETAVPMSEDSYAIDNFSIEMNGCKRRMLETPESEPIENGDDGAYYCLASDFACGDAPHMVHVCHYSTLLGYQTFCIPEADSEVLRFYGGDYCGPCVGGFGGVNLQ